ncbi:MAG: DUF3147 family protein [Candidatus Hadarchaeales archaeon]
MKASIKMVVWDFILGGTLVAAALLLAAMLNPTIGGIFAGAPIRASAVILLNHLHTNNLEATTEMARGVMVAMIANVFFAIALYLSLPRWGIVGGFLAATAVFFIAMLVIQQVTG